MTTKQRMSKRWAMIVAFGLIVIATRSPTVADQPSEVHTAAATMSGASASSSTNMHAPPPRPLPLTVEQADALEQLAMQPEYKIDPNTRAAFSPETQKKMTEASAPGFYAGYFGGLIWLLVAAAPL